VTHVPEMDAIVDHLQETVASDGMVIFLGGDDLFRLADDYIAQLREAGDA